MKKIGIVASEGGMSCAYAVGVILALVEKYQLTDPYLVVGSSGSTGTLAYYVAGQYKSIRNIWENLLPSKSFISYARLWKVMDIDYLIDDIFKSQDILNVEKIRKSRIKFFISATDAKTGEAVYFTNNGKVDIFDALRASSAAPLAFNKKVRILGGEYIDGAIGSPLSANIEKAKSEGAEIVIAVDNTNSSFLENFFLKAYAFFQPSGLKKKIWEYCGQNKLKSDPSVIVLKPSRKLPVKAFDNTKSHIKETILIGLRDASENSLVGEIFTNP